MGFQRDGRELLVVMIKATYDLPLVGQDVSLAGEQIPLIEADSFSGEPGLSTPLYETDYAHFKPACDVLLLGSAYAPAEHSVTHLQVTLKVGSMMKQFMVIGRRRWRKNTFGISSSFPEKFNVLPISYDVAFGGTDRTEEHKGRTYTFLSNPVGCGYWQHTDNISNQLLPYTQQIGHPIENPKGQYQPMAFSPIGRNWMPRCKYAGTYDQQWVENTAPFWPQDFDEHYFQAAPLDQTIPYPKGGEEVVLQNLTLDGYRAFNLPNQRMPITFILYKGNDITREAVLDTIILEPDKHRFTLTWRTNLALEKSIFDVKETVVGELSRAWHRARRFPGKQYYSNLAELARVRRSQRGS